MIVILNTQESVARARLGRQLLGFALLLGLLVFIESLRFGFVYDDRSIILENPQLAAWQGFQSYFGGNVWAHNANAVSNYFRPVYSIWLWLLYALAGLHAWGWHLGNLLLHLCVIAAFFLVTAELTGDQVAAGAASLLFGIHPVHVEVACWVSGGPPDMLCGLGLLVSYWAFLRHQKATTQSSRLWMALSLFSYTFALFSKEVALAFPAVVVAHSLIYRQSPGNLFRRSLRAGVSAVPYVLLAGGYLALRNHALGGFTQTTVNIPGAAQYLTLPLLALFYLKLFLFPAGLSPLYDLHYVLAPEVRLFWIPLLSISLVIAAFIFAHRWLGNRPGANLAANRAYLVFGAWTAAFLAPAFRIASLLPNDFAHDRYLYIPSMGLCSIAGILLTSTSGHRSRVFGMGIAQGTAFAAACIALAFTSLQQTVYWTNDLLLFSRGASVAPGSVEGLSNLAATLCERHMYDECIDLQKRILERRPDYALAYFNLSQAYLDSGNKQEAERLLSGAAQSGALDLTHMYQLASVQLDLGHLDGAEKTLEKIEATTPAAHDLPELKAELLKRKKGNH